MARRDNSKPTEVWWVVCDDATVGPFRSRTAAEHRLEIITKHGACSYPHRIESTPSASKRPVPHHEVFS